MKKVFNSLFVIIAAMVTFAGCAKQEIDAPATPETKTVQFFANSIETKTAFGTPDGTTYPTLWSNGDRVKVFLNLYSVEGSKTEDVVTVQPSEDLRTATFKSNEINDPATPEYTFYAVSPSTAYKSGSRDADNNCFVVSIPKTQEPTDASVDPSTQVIYAISSTVDAFPTSVDLSFKHFTAYCKLSFSNIDNSLGNDIKSVTVQSDDLNFVGEWKLGLDGNHMPNSETDNDAIHITTNSSENIWFACAPVDVRGKDVTFIVETSKGTATRTVKFPTDDERYQFKSGSIAKLKVNMEEAVIEIPETVQYFTKVETTPTDWSGTYLIVYETGNVAFNGSLSTLDAVSNTVPVTIAENKIQYTESLAKSTFVIAKSGESYSIKSASGYYIGNTSNANALKQDNSTEYTHTISLANGDVSLTESYNTTLKFNNTSNQKRFRYYKSGQEAIQLYKLAGSGSEGGEGGETPVEKTLESITVAGAKTEYTVGDEFVEPTVTATYSDGSTEDVTASAEFTGYNMSAAGTYTVTVSYSGKTTTYSITVSAAQGGGSEDVEYISIINVANINAVKTMGNGSYGDYKDTDVTVTINELSLIAKNICANSKDGNVKMAAKQFIQIQASKGYIYNTDKTVKSVKVWTLPSKSDIQIATGSAQNPTTLITLSNPSTESVVLLDNNNTEVSTTLNVYEVNLEESKSYFKISASKAAWVYKVEVTYTN